MSRSDQALVTILLTTRLIKRDSEPFSAREFWALGLEDPAELLGVDASEVESRLQCAPDAAKRIASLLDSATALAIELERLESTGVRVITLFDEEYPARLVERLRAAAPPVLHVAGPVSLLGVDGIGIVGSRNVGAEAREVASEIARAAVGAGLSVVSGVARGIDQVAMAAALEAEGAVVGIPADALNKQVRDPSVRRAITDERLCLATPYSPAAGFSVGVAMGRNKLIYGLSQVTVVVTADSGKGGTWAGAEEALKAGIAPVAVWMGTGAGTGNEALAGAGGVAVKSSQDVLDVSRDVVDTAKDESTQLRMGL